MHMPRSLTTPNVSPPPRSLATIAETLFVRSPSVVASQAAGATLQAFPEPLLRVAAALPIRIWLLDHDESVEAVPLLDLAIRRQRWLDGTVGPGDCAGLTVASGPGALVIAPWHRPAVLRHEIGHALGGLLSERQRRSLASAYAAARRADRFLVPLAGRSIGEYLACGVAHRAVEGGSSWLAALDPGLGAVLDQLWRAGVKTRPSLAYFLCSALRLMPRASRLAAAS